MSQAATSTFFLDDFALKQFNDTSPDYSGTRIHYDLPGFVKRVEQYHEEGRQLVSGYAPFCKHIFVPNFTGAKLGSLTVTEKNVHLLKSGYSRRRPEELPVLSRYTCDFLILACVLTQCNKLVALIALGQVVSAAGRSARA